MGLPTSAPPMLLLMLAAAAFAPACGAPAPTVPDERVPWVAEAVWAEDAATEIVALATAADSRTRAFVVWFVNETSPAGGIWAKVLEPDGSGGPPVKIAPIDEGVTVRSPVVAAGGDGHAYVLWARAEAGQSLLWWSRREGTAWTVPEVLTTGTDGQLAVDSEGNALLAWFDRPSLLVRGYRADTRTWGTALELGTWTAFAEVLVAGVALEGTEAATFWAEIRTGAGYETRSVRSVGDRWVTERLGLGSGPVAIDRTGAAVGTFTFRPFRIPGPTATFSSRVAPRGGGWSERQMLATDGRGTLALARSPAGDLAVAYGRLVDESDEVWSRRFTGADFGPGQLVYRAPVGHTLWQVALSIPGPTSSVLAWAQQAPHEGDYQIWASVKGPRGVWSLPDRLDERGRPCDAPIASTLGRHMAALSLPGQTVVIWTARGCNREKYLWAARRPWLSR